MRSALSTSGMLRYRVRAPTFVRFSSCWRKLRQMVPPVVLTVGPFLRRLSAIRLPIILHISFYFWSGRMNSAPLACDSRREKSIGTMGRCMFFETFESKNSIYFVPQPRFSMPGGVDLLMCTSFLYACLIRWCDVNYWLSAFEKEIWAGKIPIRTVGTVRTVSFQEMAFSPSYYIYI